ncbi:MAG: exodeoxyribonuclease VII small subunit [Gammaproteobacteria bacterium]|nr:exodeoxyribonuclease VII small subunit [Gammaproteobacteria bacterium]MYF38844.1 exodeoxyribonuclease VII small subunit [Gammaproteobacteria bacterium]
MSEKEEHTAVDFEKDIAELEALVSKMESGELTLEESLTAFEKGVGLARRCQRSLADAEARVAKLMKEMNFESDD